jgi:hypothetical protein
MLLVSALLLCGVASAVPTVTITAPAGGTTTGSPVQITANATSTRAITLMQVYVDGAKKYEVRAANLNTTLTLATGSHHLTVQAYDSSGIGKTSLNFSVGALLANPTSATLATFSNVEQLTGWQSCDACAGPGGAGPTAPHSITQNVASPSLDGSAAQFWLGGETRYSNALWWKQLGARDSATKFTYDLYFYLKNPSVSQALEFDVNQTLNGNMYIFGTECNLKGSKTWRVFDNYDKWIDTGIACTVPTAYAWHHLVWEFQRTSDNRMHFLSVTLDGKKSYVDQKHRPRPKSVRELNVAFQMDGNSTMTDYSTWLDKVTLKIW